MAMLYIFSMENVQGRDPNDNDRRIAVGVKAEGGRVREHLVPYMTSHNGQPCMHFFHFLKLCTIHVLAGIKTVY